jgi:hypothetical protein
MFRSGAVAGSPAAAAETIVCTVTVTGDWAVATGVYLFGYCTLTVGTSGVSVLTRLRQTDTSGTVVKASGATTATAGNLIDRSIMGVDTNPTLGRQVYVMTLTIGSGAAASTVSAAELVAIVV